MAIKNRLPRKLSELLELALEDLEKTENTPGFRIDMNRWLDNIHGNCVACLAGSVMVQQFCKPPKEDECAISPIDLYVEQIISYDDFVRLKALDCLRTGQIRRAYETLCHYDLDFQDVFVTDYDDDSVLWHECMQRVLNELKGHEHFVEKDI